jgi:hypothetical protein
MRRPPALLRLPDEQLRRRERGQVPAVDEDLGGSSRAVAPISSPGQGMEISKWQWAQHRPAPSAVAAQRALHRKGDDPAHRASDGPDLVTERGPVTGDGEHADPDDPAPRVPLRRGRNSPVGWLAQDNVISTRPPDRLQEFLHKKR